MSGNQGYQAGAPITRACVCTCTYTHTHTQDYSGPKNRTQHLNTAFIGYKTRMG